MSRDAKASFDWGDGHYTFRFGLGEIEELEEQLDFGIYWLLPRVQARQCKTKELRETIRLGLIGGGLEPVKALSLVNRYCFPARPILESITPVIAILSAALMGAPDGEAPGKAKAARARKKPPKEKTESSPLPQSTEPVQQ